MSVFPVFEKRKEQKQTLQKIPDIDGLYYIDNIFSKKLSKELLGFLEKNPNYTSVSKHNNSRKVLQYGYKYDYTTKSQKNEKINDIPDIFINLIKLIEKFGFESEEYTQCIVNKYLPGQGISPHIDHKNFGPIICCFTIGGGTTINFEKNGIKKSLYVNPNSLYIMSKDARYKWKHSIAGNKTDFIKGKRNFRETRYSITYRSMANMSNN